MAKHTVDREIGFAGVGRSQNGFDGAGGMNGHDPSIPTPAPDCNRSHAPTKITLRRRSKTRMTIDSSDGLGAPAASPTSDVVIYYKSDGYSMASDRLMGRQLAGQAF
jgi:hypothetical protein